jgi:hypothetical protein
MVKVKLVGNPRKDLVKRNTHVKYENSNAYLSKF